MVSLDRNGLEILDRQECLALLQRRDLGRVGLVAQGLPAILPVNYRVLDDDVVFATGTGSKLAPVRPRSGPADEWCWCAVRALHGPRKRR